MEDLARRWYRRMYWWRDDRRLRAPLRGIRAVVAFGASLGDNLLCSTVLDRLYRSGLGPVAMLTDYPDLFAGSTYPVRLLPFDPALIASLRRGGPALYQPNYGIYNPATDRHEPVPRDHLLVELCRSVGLKGTIRLSPLFQLTAAELAQAEWAREHLVFQVSAASASVPSKNKEWGPARFQAVANALQGLRPIIQLGNESDPLLAGALDFRGKLSRRESAAILAQARLLVGLEGFLMHLARAVDCPAVIVFGGRLAPHQAGYSGHTNLFTALSCSPCWRKNTCPYDRICLSAITPADVAAAVADHLAKPRAMPAADLVEL